MNFVASKRLDSRCSELQHDVMHFIRSAGCKRRALVLPRLDFVVEDAYEIEQSGVDDFCTSAKYSAKVSLAVYAVY